MDEVMCEYVEAGAPVEYTLFIGTKRKLLLCHGCSQSIQDYFLVELLKGAVHQAVAGILERANRKQ